MPEDIVQLLSDSKDMLEDPSNSNINFFDLDTNFDQPNGMKTQRAQGENTDLID